MTRLIALCYMYALAILDGTPEVNRTCNLCFTDIGNEYHYLFQCSNEMVKRLREMYIPSYYYRNHSVIKMKGLFTICNITVLTNICKFLKKIEKLLIEHVHH